jgi:Tfp pilus assembly protein PilV
MTFRRTRRRRQAGFSLIETFIASVILFIALFGMTVITNAAAANNRMASLTVDAMRLAQSRLNSYAAFGVTGLQQQMAAAAVVTLGVATLESMDTVDPSGRTIHVVVQASDVSIAKGIPAGSGVCLLLQVTVSWISALRVPQSQVTSTFVSSSG